ncbi:uncharacterized protein LOC141850688 isoform X2 [Brevipalpus obovatus]|uniref:uncharacterized protein LOC141850688 isoform X2 n=1 Tax=Brevipalpus obovatus TaxID=246614 RepID=UPI003D9DCB75
MSSAMSANLSWPSRMPSCNLNVHMDPESLGEERFIHGNVVLESPDVNQVDTPVLERFLTEMSNVSSGINLSSQQHNSHHQYHGPPSDPLASSCCLQQPPPHPNQPPPPSQQPQVSSSGSSISPSSSSLPPPPLSPPSSTPPHMSSPQQHHHHHHNHHHQHQHQRVHQRGSMPPNCSEMKPLINPYSPENLYTLHTSPPPPPSISNTISMIQGAMTADSMLQHHSILHQHVPSHHHHHSPHTIQIKSEPSNSMLSPIHPAMSTTTTTTIGQLASMSGGSMAILNTSPSSSNVPPPINMDEQEIKKSEHKKMRNRIAASKCRKKKMEKIKLLEAKVDSLKKENASLNDQLNRLRGEVGRLKDEVVVHMQNGCDIAGPVESDQKLALQFRSRVQI